MKYSNIYNRNFHKRKTRMYIYYPFIMLLCIAACSKLKIVSIANIFAFDVTMLEYKFIDFFFILYAYDGIPTWQKFTKCYFFAFKN